jgi:hypothetical protein
LDGVLTARSRFLAAISAKLSAKAEISFSARKPDKMRALSATHT